MGLIARELEVRYGMTIVHALLRHPGEAQKSLDYEGRQQNLKGAFAATDGAARLDAECVLLDDVFTTGATADECSAVLRDCGVQRITVLTVALD